MLTDSEVDRRFSMLVADLNLAVQAVEWPVMSERAAEWTPRGPIGGETRPNGIAVLRLSGAGMLLATVAVGVFVLWTLNVGVVVGLLWFGVLVPALTLAAVTLVDRVRRRS